jgi:hypothetical protein
MIKNLPALVRTALLFSLINTEAVVAEDIQLSICDHVREYRSEDFDPLSEPEKSMAESRVGTVSGRAVIAAADSAPLGQIVRQAATLSGRTLIWFFEISNPMAIALGYILIPTSTARCDVEFSREPSCLRGKPCIAKF